MLKANIGKGQGLCGEREGCNRAETATCMGTRQ